MILITVGVVSQKIQMDNKRKRRDIKNLDVSRYKTVKYEVYKEMESTENVKNIKRKRWLE